MFVAACWTLLALRLHGAGAFNLDTAVPVVKRSNAAYDTYFGFSVAAHRLQQSDEIV